jgi:hypothetical protein
MAINKVMYGNSTLMDITDTTAIAEDVASGKIFYTKDGVQRTGTASSSTPTVASASVTNSSNQTTSLEFTVAGEPKMFALMANPSTSFTISNNSYYFIVSMMCDGTHIYGNYTYKNSRVYKDQTHYSYTYSNGKLKVSSSGSRGSSGGAFYNTTYLLYYIY